MGWSYYEITYPDTGEVIEAGYAVEAVCDEPGCEETIDRGLYHRCGGMDSARGCQRHFCGNHILMPSLCARCLDYHIYEAMPGAQTVYRNARRAGGDRAAARAEAEHFIDDMVMGVS